MVAPVVIPIVPGAAIAGTTVAAVPTATATGVTATAASPLLLGLGLLVGGGMTAATTWSQFAKRRIGELQADHGMSYREAQKQAGREFKQGGKVASNRKTTKLTGQRSLSAEIPYIVEASPDIAAAWDIAEGIVDGLIDNAAPRDDAAAFSRRADAAYARAKGPSVESDTVEYQMGTALAEAVLMVLSRRGVTADGWARMTPPQLPRNSRGVGAVGEGVLDILGIGTDLDGDGDTSTVGDAVGTAAETVLSLFD